MKSCFYLTSVFIISILFWNCHLGNKEVVSSAVEKIQSKEEIPAFNRELIIDIDGDSIAGYALIASGITPKETVLLVAGYPGNDNNFDIAQAIRRSGKNVIHFNHRGAWGSQGEYNYSNCLEDIEKLIVYFSQPNVADDLRINPKIFTLLGRSYGGGIALIQGSQIPAVQKIIAISSVNYGVIMEKYHKLEELSGFKKYMKKQVMMNTHIDRFLQELLDNKKAYNIITYKEQLAKKKVLLIEDSDKNQNWISQLDKTEFIVLESDHNFIDKRIELTNLIVDWLDHK